jgi:hypothetical protein
MMAAGVIRGGWGFVIAAYSISVLVLLGYALSIHLRYRAERARRHREARHAEAGS